MQQHYPQTYQQSVSPLQHTIPPSQHYANNGYTPQQYYPQHVMASVQSSVGNEWDNNSGLAALATLANQRQLQLQAQHPSIAYQQEYHETNEEEHQ